VAATGCKTIQPTNQPLRLRHPRRQVFGWLATAGNDAHSILLLSLSRPPVAIIAQNANIHDPNYLLCCATGVEGWPTETEDQKMISNNDCHPPAVAGMLEKRWLKTSLISIAQNANS
jgi:hypothetical protein